MLLYTQNQSEINEALTLTKVVKDRFDSSRVVIVSDLEDKNKATSEVISVKDILKKHGFRWDSSEKQWWLNDKFKPIEQVIDIAKKAVAEANEKLKQSNEVNEIISKLEDIKDFVKTAPVSTEADVTKDDITKKLEGFINELADEVDSVRLTGKIKDYFDFLSKFPKYSFTNQILIYIQNSDATTVNSKTGWSKLGLKPKEGAKQILIWRPTLKPPSAAEKAERREKFLKGIKGGLTPDKQKQLDKILKAPVVSMPFVLYPVYDTKDVVKEDGSEYVEPEKVDLEWFDETENEVADKIFEAMTKVYDDYGIDFAIEDAKGSEKGYSASGKIRISSDTKGIAKASTAIHEFAHELMHQTFLLDKVTERGYDSLTKQEKIALKTREKQEKTESAKDGDKLSGKNKHILDAYVGRDTSEVLELQAESVAYVVLKSFEVPGLKYAVNYIALWKGTKDTIMGNLDVITTTANIIIKSLNKHIDNVNEVDGESDIHGDKVSIGDVAKLLKAPINKSIDEIIGDINESISIFKKIIK